MLTGGHFEMNVSKVCDAQKKHATHIEIVTSAMSCVEVEYVGATQ